MASWRFKLEGAAAETPAELSRRYMRELQEMVDDRAISAEVANRILDDLFEPAVSGRPRQVTWSTWVAYVAEMEKRAGA